MVKATLVEESEYRYEEGWYALRLESVKAEEVEFTYKESHAAVKRGDARVGQKGSFVKWRWTCKFVGGDYSGDTISADTQNRVTTRDDDLARKLYEAFLGRPLELGEAIDTDLVEGMVAEGLVTHDAPSTNRSGEVRYYCSVRDARPANGDTATSPFDDEPPF